MTFALRFKGVVKKFGKCRALDGFDLDVPAGSAMGLVGANGAGKTTSFAVASGYERIDAGEIDLFEEGPFKPERHAGRVAVMPQDADFPPYATVKELLNYFAGLQGISGVNMKKAVSTVLDWVRLKDRADAKISTLSHGMRRRVVIAQAFLGEPDLVMLDEPMSGLDPREVVNIRQLLKDRPGHQTVIISSHNLHEVERVCDHIAFINKGRLVRQSAMDAVTGRHHQVSYHIGPDKALDLQELCLCLPGVILEIAENGVLSCEFADANQTIDEVNAVVLKYLIDKKISVFEVKRGDDLESVYMGDKDL